MSDDIEKKEIETISDESVYLDLGGKKRKLHIGMRGWKEINPEFGGIGKILGIAKENPDSFLFDVVPRLIQIAILGGEHEQVSIESVLDWLDVYGLNDIKNVITPAVMNAMMKSLPEGKEKKNPPKAKP
jgi:hypothetical protein